MTTTTTDTATTRVLEDLIDVDRRVSEQIRLLLADRMGAWSADPVVGRALASYQVMALSGGKRLRPGFAYWSFRGAGGDVDDEVILRAATAIELLHVFALIHDDVMDEAPTRRGIETLHVTYAEAHRAAGGRGDSAHYGESVAILLGDLAFTQAAQMVSRLPGACREVFFAVCADLMVGQLLDIEAAASGVVPGERTASRIAELKTSGYSVVGPLLLGAAAAGRLDELRPHLEAYGDPVGQAFQMRDDLLGAFGDPERTGKPVGDDLAQGKVTMLLEVGRELVDGEGLALLDRLGTADMGPDDVDGASELLVASGARDAVEAEIVRLVDQAATSIRQAPLDPEVQEILVAAAIVIAHRDH